MNPQPGSINRAGSQGIEFCLQITVRKCLHQRAKSTKQVRHYRLMLPHIVTNFLSLAVFAGTEFYAHRFKTGISFELVET